MTRPFVVHIDRENETVRINVADEVAILEVGEFSEWMPIEFDVMGPFSKISGITRFYLKALEPHFQLYATPININPGDPALPISEPAGFTKNLYEKIGYYYTQGMPEDTKAFEWGIFTDAEFVKQTEIVFQERLAMLDAVLDDYNDGFLFFYFSSIDQTCHMLWRNMDPNHPGHTAENAKYGGRIEDLYTRMDSVLGSVRERIPEDATLIVMSDHGFAPYYKKVNLNTWLYENDFMTLRKPKEVGRSPLFRNVFWRRTKAYGLGINGLYVNLRGRESQGIVRPEEYDALVDEIAAKLLAYRDPETGEQVVKRVYRADQIYDGDALGKAPDIIVGYTAGYRGGDDSALGHLSKSVISLNMDKWSGDHCMAYEEVPGIFLSNRPLAIDDPNLTDMAVTILRLYGMEPPENMVGRSVFSVETLSSR
ncbi:MAG: alkaline phosphatase family protein [bacterium]|nr:alkaline phosphatase family protein [bacterium]